MARRVRSLVPVVRVYGPFSDTTTIALFALAAKRRGEVCVWLPTAWFFPHKIAFLPIMQVLYFQCIQGGARRAIPFVAGRYKTGEAHHDRHAALRNARRNHDSCRGCRCGVRLDAAAGDVCLDAARDGPARCCTVAPRERDGAIGAGVRVASLSPAIGWPGGGPFRVDKVPPL